MDLETAPRQHGDGVKRTERRGLLMIHTGDGKGKTTAALGLAVRALGRGKSVRFFQFMKVAPAQFGEHRSVAKLGLQIEGLGDGFSWKSRDLERSAQLAREGFERAAAAIASGDHFLVVLDEVTYPLLYGWLPLERVLECLHARPVQTTVLLTGRRAPPELVAIADAVTEMTLVRHHYDAGIAAQRGIED